MNKAMRSGDNIALFSYCCMLGIMIIVATCGIIYGILGMIDSDSKELINISQISCIDLDGHEFVDELCYKETYCSKMGIAGDVKCSKVRR